MTDELDIDAIVAEIRETGRNAAGVRLIKLDERDKLVAIAKIEAEEVDGEKEIAPDSAPPDTSEDQKTN